MTDDAHLLVLWDIDGTLVNSGGHGTEIFDVAVAAVLGSRPLTRPAFSGKTDRLITEEYLLGAGSADPDHVPLVLDQLARGMAAVAEAVATDGFVYPGGIEALEALARLGTVSQTVLTGNIAANAALKLSAFGLDRFLDLEVGAYGGDHTDRRLLLPLAWAKQRELRHRDYSPSSTWIIGDTPRDLECASAGGAHCLLVATGTYALAELETLDADAVLPDLRDTERVVGILRGGRRV